MSKMSKCLKCLKCLQCNQIQIGRWFSDRIATLLCVLCLTCIMCLICLILWGYSLEHKTPSKVIQVFSQQLYFPNFCLNYKLLQGD